MKRRSKILMRIAMMKSKRGMMMMLMMMKVTMIMMMMMLREMVVMKRADHKFRDQWREADSAIGAPLQLFFFSIFQFSSPILSSSAFLYM